jgi:hypothetical protein
MSWFKTRDIEDPIEIECPHCSTAQSVSPTIRATFCKSCGKTIYTKSAVKKPSGPAAPPPAYEEESEAEVIPPPAPPGAKAAPASPAQKHGSPAPSQPRAPKAQAPVPPPAAPAAPQRPASPAFRPSSENQTKSIKCSYCHTMQQVPSIALASFCEKCGRRINLQDYQIRGHFRGELETRGEIRIAQEADVQGNLDVGIAIIEGRMEGEILAESRVTLEPNSLVVGTINAPALVVHDGAGFVGKAAINPMEDMESGII